MKIASILGSVLVIRSKEKENTFAGVDLFTKECLKMINTMVPEEGLNMMEVITKDIGKMEKRTALGYNNSVKMAKMVHMKASGQIINIKGQVS